jgi:hypothetical protein
VIDQWMTQSSLGVTHQRVAGRVLDACDVVASYFEGIHVLALPALRHRSRPSSASRSIRKPKKFDIRIQSSYMRSEYE